MVSIYLAETSPPEGSLVLFGRVFLLEEEGPEVLPLGEDPLLGPTQARRILVGSLEELLGHPILQEAARRLQREYLAARAQGKGAEEVRERARRVGLEGALEEVEEKARELERVGIALRAGGVPAGFLGDAFGVGNPPVFRVASLEEAERVAQAYTWAREAGIRLIPLPRGRQGEIRFAAPIVFLKPENGEVRFPVRGRGPYRLDEGRLVGVGLPPRGVRVVGLPWER